MKIRQISQTSAFMSFKALGRCQSSADVFICDRSLLHGICLYNRGFRFLVLWYFYKTHSYFFAKPRVLIQRGHLVGTILLTHPAHLTFIKCLKQVRNTRGLATLISRCVHFKSEDSHLRFRSPTSFMCKGIYKISIMTYK